MQLRKSQNCKAKTCTAECMCKRGRVCKPSDRYKTLMWLKYGGKGLRAVTHTAVSNHTHTHKIGRAHV